MASPLSPRKLRAELSGFFHPSHYSYSPSSGSSDTPPSSAASSVFAFHTMATTESPGRSRSRLPFLGRRKKSKARAEHSEIGAFSDYNPQDGEEIYSPSSRPSTPTTASTPSPLPPSPVPTVSGSFLSRLTRPKSAKKPTNGYLSDTHLPPSTTNTPTASRRQSRSITPRPKGETVDDCYADLFTRPRASLSALPSHPASPTEADVPPPLPTNRENRRTIGATPRGHVPHGSHSSVGSSLFPPLHSPPKSPLPTPPTLEAPPRMSRARAQTLSSVSSASSRSSPSIPAVPIIATPVPRRSKSVHSEQRQSIEQTGSPTKDSRSIDTALPEELRQIAHAQADRIEELSACIVRLTQSHTSEKHALERRVNLLERELGRKEKEIQGLTWLVRSDKSPISESASKSSPSLDSPMLDGAIQLPIIKLPTIRRIDAGYGTDTPDSSGNESNYSTRTTRAKRSSKILHSGRTLRPSPESPLPALPPSLDRRASSSSLASSRSAASSTSSLPLALASPLPPQLTSIPERAPPVPRLPSSSLHDPAIIAALNSRREKEMRRASVRTLPATPVQKAAPAPTPAAAYAANLMQGRKPTISQLLDDAPIPPTSRPSVSQ